MSERPSSDQGRTQDPLADTRLSADTWPDLSGILEDRNGDGFPDYLNARIYVAEDAATQDLAAAANLAARFAFETMSMNLPLGFGMNEFSEADSTVAIVIGRAALPWAQGRSGISEARAGSRRVVALVRAEDANRWARNLDCAGSYSDTALPKRTVAAAGKSDRLFSLAELFRGEGLLGQSPGSIVADSIDTVLWLGPDVQSPAVIDLAARLALETTGMTLPLVFQSDTDPKNSNAILIGATHPQLRHLRNEHQGGCLSPGEGQLRLVERPHQTGVNLVVLGGDRAGEIAALRYAAGQLPFVSNYGSGNLELKDIESDLDRFLSLRSAEGQFAAGLSRARRMMESEPPEKVANGDEVTITVDGADEDLRRYAATCHPAKALKLRDTRSYETTFDEAVTLQWEVDCARTRFHETVLPHVRNGSRVEIELRVSESADVRRVLATEIRDQLLARGADAHNIGINVLSAFKQGYSWIDEVLKPELAAAKSITIRVRETESATAHLLDSKSRWIQELYPIDEVLARDLGLPTSAIEIELTQDGPTYQVIAHDGDGAICLDRTFEPTFVTQPLFEDFPDYASSQVSTGWIRAKVGSATRLDERVQTDPEQVWTVIQRRGLRKLGEYFRALYGAAPPTEAAAPHFNVFEIDVELSGPDYRIGIDEERISTPEALHEDLYFNTLLFIALFSEKNYGVPLDHPGRVIPRVRPSDTGTGPRIRMRLTGKTESGAAVELTSRGGRRKRRRTALVPTGSGRSRVDSITVRHGFQDVTLGIVVPPATSTSGNARDRAVEIRDMLTTIGEMREQGLVRRTLNYAGVGCLVITWEDAGHPARVVLNQVEPIATGRPRLEEVGYAPKTRLTEALDSAQTEAHIARLASLPEVRPFYAGQSFLGKPIWALEVTSRLEGRYISRSRLSVAKPVLFLTGRQHGNEVSSTSHILQLVEWLASEDAGRHLLERVNLIVQPMTNPDGADLASELSQVTPDFMLHAGYTGCLGVDVTRDQWISNPICPESGIRRELWTMWRPDVVLDPHGYPSHEWVQLFGGHAAWFRSREKIRRDWWIPRGAFIPNFDAVRDPSFPHHESTACAIRDRLAQALTDTMKDVNERMYARYRKYLGACHMPLPWETHAGLLVYPSGVVDGHRTAGGKRPKQSFMTRHPEITVFQCAIELPDETASGEWLERLTRAGFEASLACVRFLAECEYQVSRLRFEDGQAITFRIERQRPVRPPRVCTSARRPSP